MTDSNFDLLAAKLSGVAGALLSLNFIKGTWPERFAMGMGGAIISLYATPYIVQKTGLPDGLAGFLVGMFGMAITAKVWEAIQIAPVRDIWNSTIQGVAKRLGG
ncbi:MAG: hypothetical protein KGI54_08705 [Pseudomonadota bacterium]|nr:hypothetical protein [Pseudomonadota bacterium]